jgi:hypothetical protein
VTAFVATDRERVGERDRTAGRREGRLQQQRVVDVESIEPPRLTSAADRQSDSRA